MKFILLRLRVLNLSNNDLTVLPNEIGKLSELVHLRLDNNQLSNISPALGNLQCLEVMNFMT